MASVEKQWTGSRKGKKNPSIVILYPGQGSYSLLQRKHRIAFSPFYSPQLMLSQRLKNKSLSTVDVFISKI